MSSVTQESGGGKHCPICREVHEPGRGLSFDGCGINSCGVYRSRIAKIEPDYLSVGPMLAAAPDLFDALEEICHLPVDDEGYRVIPPGFLDNARAALAKAVPQ